MPIYGGSSFKLPIIYCRKELKVRVYSSLCFILFNITLSLSMVAFSWIFGCFDKHPSIIFAFALVESLTLTATFDELPPCTCRTLTRQSWDNRGFSLRTRTMVDLYCLPHTGTSTVGEIFSSLHFSSCPIIVSSSIASIDDLAEDTF